MTTQGSFCWIVRPNQPEKKRGQEVDGFQGTAMVWAAVMCGPII